MTQPKKTQWRDAATLLAVAGLVVTMIFNTVGVRQTAKSAAASRADADMSLLTSLSLYAQQTDLALARSNAAAAAAECNHRRQLRPQDVRLLLGDLETYDYMAWLMSQRSWKLPKAVDYWAPSMLRALEIAENDVPNMALNHQFASLYAFRQRWVATHRYKPKC